MSTVWPLVPVVTVLASVLELTALVTLGAYNAFDRTTLHRQDICSWVYTYSKLPDLAAPAPTQLHTLLAGCRFCYADIF